MAGLVQGAWTENYENGMYIAECAIYPDTTISDAYTLKTPTGLDPSEPWQLHFWSTIAVDNSVPIDIWVGWHDNFALSGNTTTVSAGAFGAEYKQIMDDAVLAVLNNPYIFDIDPNSTAADVVTAAAIADGFKVKVPVAPYYAFNIDGDTLVDTDCFFKIVQKSDKKGI